ncbi:MAG: phosphoglucomutase/phosphomannomutase family protein [Flavobacteriales bacterium]
MSDIKFGTDGWRALIAKDYTVDNVARVSIAVSNWLNNNYSNPSIVLGHDCRFGGKLFSETVAKVLTQYNIKVKMSEGFVSTPMVSLGVVKESANLGVVITASHNPPTYNGYKLKGDFGGPLLPNKISEVEKLIPEINNIDLEKINFQSLINDGRVEIIDLETMYCEHVKSNFDLDLINKSNMKFAYDAMYGAGMNVVKKLLPTTTLLHCEDNPGFKGVAPEPIYKNLHEFSELMKTNDSLCCGFATDGDADRIGLFSSDGSFVDSHHAILLLIHYLVKYKGLSGKVVTAFSCTDRIKLMCKHYNLDQETVKIGFKHIAGKMVSEDVLLGGEESGGIATNGHIPERDGIWMGLILFEFMAKSGKTIEELIAEVYEIVGEFSFERVDLHLTDELKGQVVDNCKKGTYSSFGDYKVLRTENIDGYKYFFENDAWLLIRPSGTEPVLRTYAESSSSDKAFDILNAVKSVIES